MPTSRSFFDTLEHGWLVKFLEHRVADRRIVRLIQKWLNAGVLEDGERTWSEVGTVQGGSISPLLANLYLHYAFDGDLPLGIPGVDRGQLPKEHEDEWMLYLQ